MTDSTQQTQQQGDQNTQQQTTQTTQQTGGDQQTNQQQASWWSSIDFGDASKDQSTASLLNGFKTPTDLLKSLSGLKENGDLAKDWRRALAGDDEKEYAHLQRFSTLADYHKSGVEARKKISAGELAKPLPKDATPEQVAEWRKGNGIPEKPEGYREKLPNGLVIGEDDVPIIDKVLAGPLHKHGIRPEAVHEVIQEYYKFQDEQVQAQQAADAQAKPALETKLREAWGADFKANANIYQSFIAGAPEGVREALTTARDNEGNFILYKPEVVSWLVQQAREINPAAHITPAGNEGTVQSIQGEIDSIEKFMRSDRTAYNKDEAKQARLRQLYEARIKLQKRGQAA